MTDSRGHWTTAFLFVTTISLVNSYKILGVFPSAARSHFFVGDSLMRSLLQRGHEITVISPFPPTTPVENYRNIHTPAILKKMGVRMDNVAPKRQSTSLRGIQKMYELGLTITNSTLSEPTFQNLIVSNESFDIVVCEIFMTDALFGLAEHFNASLIGLSTLGANIWSTSLVGSPSPTSYVPNPFLSLMDKMTLRQRILNQAFATFEYIFFNQFYMPKQNALFQKHFPNSALGLEKIRKNTALVLLNSHTSLGFPRPYMPNMIEVGGMHIKRQKKPLPADMQQFLDGAKDGVIYFSMGSSLNSKVLPPEKRDIILETFRSLRQRVMWKFEDPDLPGKSENVFICDWFPQSDILAHPNVQLFITHGGLLSVIESLYHQKPIVGIPMFGDQFLNMAHAEGCGYGITVDYNLLSKGTFLSAINKMLTDPSYTTRVKEISERYRDQPMEPLDLATYWVEYIARHKGAPYLHSAGQDLNFIQYHNLDAMMVLYGRFLVVGSLIVYTMIMVLSKFLGIRKMEVKKKED